ncbi:MAG: TetR family transcriptional regulator [Chloroflexales bacterium]|nr:TetR family transcriptional regulator [Chloroflexales bacterium]
MTQKQRARSTSDKQQRRAQILDAALALWAERTFASFTMAEVAERCGLAKGTPYLYFATKEELFLALLERMLTAWFDALDAGLAAPETWGSERGATLICATLAANPHLARMLPIASSILEHNISPEAARAYKSLLLNRVAYSGGLLEARLPFLRGGEGTWLLLQVYALVVGLGQMADPAPVVRAILDEPAMAPLRVAFGPMFAQALTLLLRGLATREDL